MDTNSNFFSKTPQNGFRGRFGVRGEKWQKDTFGQKNSPSPLRERYLAKVTLTDLPSLYIE